MEHVVIKNIMRVKKATLKREEISKRFILTTENIAFNTRYITHIPIEISDEEWGDLKKTKSLTYRDAKSTPLLHKIKWQAVKYLKETNKIQ